jgi:hypothetical protein
MYDARRTEAQEWLEEFDQQAADRRTFLT